MEKNTRVDLFCEAFLLLLAFALVVMAAWQHHIGYVILFSAAGGLLLIDNVGRLIEMELQEAFDDSVENEPLDNNSEVFDLPGSGDFLPFVPNQRKESDNA